MKSRPALRLLENELIDRIVAEAREVLSKLGVEIHNHGVLALLADHGAAVDCKSRRVRSSPGDHRQGAATTVPRSFQLFDVLGNETHDFAGDNVYFTPGSAAINILDGATGEMRRPTTADYVRYREADQRPAAHRLARARPSFPADVHERISDSYRLYLSLLYGEKPVVTGAFTIEASRS